MLPVAVFFVQPSEHSWPFFCCLESFTEKVESDYLIAAFALLGVYVDLEHWTVSWMQALMALMSFLSIFSLLDVRFVRQAFPYSWLTSRLPNHPMGIQLARQSTLGLLKSPSIRRCPMFLVAASRYSSGPSVDAYQWHPSWFKLHAHRSWLRIRRYAVHFLLLFSLELSATPILPSTISSVIRSIAIVQFKTGLDLAWPSILSTIPWPPSALPVPFFFSAPLFFVCFTVDNRPLSP